MPPKKCAYSEEELQYNQENQTVVCPKCKGTLGVGLSGVGNFENHLDSKKCKQAQAKLAAVEKLPKTGPQAFLQPQSRAVPGLATQSQSIPFRLPKDTYSSGPRLAAASSTSRFGAFSGTFTEEHAPHTSKDQRVAEIASTQENPMKYDLTHSESELDKQISAFVRRKTKEICNGYRLPIPHGYSPHLVYPFALHETQNLPWDYSFRQGFMYVTSPQCQRLGASSGLCSSCAKLEENKALQDIIQRIEDGVHETSPFEYHGIGSLMNLAKHKQAQIDAYQLQGSNQAQQLLRQATIIDDYKRLLSKATDSMHQPSVRTGDEAGKQPAPMQPAPMKWDTFVKFMREKGFQYDPSTAGSSVRFNPPDPCDSPITIHKPHPDPTLGPIKLVQIEKRLKRYYGWWNEEDLIRQPR